MYQYLHLRTVIMLLAMVSAVLGFFPFVLTAEASANRYQVVPGVLELDNNVKTGAITIRNEGQERGLLSIFPTEWTQDEHGKDSYRDTEDLVVYPKLMILQQGEQRTIRVGYKGAALIRERSFRLLIAERSEAANQNNSGKAADLKAQTLIFVKPDVRISEGSVEKIDLTGRELSAVIRNKGDVHLIVLSVGIHGLAANGQELFKKELAGSYVLSNASRTFSAEVPFPVCRKLAQVVIEVSTSSGALKGKLNISQDMCGQ